MVEKRFGVGWTINFGNRWSVLTLSGLLAAIVLILILNRRTGQVSSLEEPL
ncbi:MAG TPA: DUF5808 domain-containing protein [Ktedonobacterales bacterium]|nr:DUF5808 domain-containing protein [Ktedonobacterales bacterium]